MQSLLGRRKRGQIWTTDFVIGLMLFIVILIVVTKMLLNVFPSSNYEVVYRDAVYLSDSLLSDGYPSNWTTTNVILPGIGENNRINSTKLENFKDMDYSHTKSLMHVTSDYLFFIRNSTDIINTGQCIYGYPVATGSDCTPNMSTHSYDTLVKINRLVIYNSTVMTMVLYAWD